MNERFFHVVWRVVGPILRFFYPLEVSGLENLPASGAMLCPNHSSLWDPVLLAITTPIDYHLRIMAKEELFRIPLLGPIISRLVRSRSAGEIRTFNRSRRPSVPFETGRTC